MWMYGKLEVINHGNPWMIMDIHNSAMDLNNSILDIHHSVMDIRVTQYQ